MNRDFVVFDTETATVRGAPHLLEIGAVRVRAGEAIEHFEALVRPEVPIDPAAEAIHGIREADVRDARLATDVLGEFARFARDDWIVAHNASFDAHVLGFEAARHAVELPSAPLIDTLKLARRLIPDASDHKLETLTQHLDIDVDVRHRALADAVSCWRVLEECARRLESTRPSGEPDEWLDLEILRLASARTTLRGARPREPRVPQRLRSLADACRAQGRVTLHYGTDESCTRLPVTPRLLFMLGDRGYLEAECHRSGTIKTYRLDRVLRVHE